MAVASSQAGQVIFIYFLVNKTCTLGIINLPLVGVVYETKNQSITFLVSLVYTMYILVTQKSGDNQPEKAYETH